MQNLDSDTLVSEQGAFWKKELAGFTRATPLVVDSAPQPTIRALNPAIVARRTISGAEQHELRRFAERHQVDLANVIRGAWMLVLQRYSDQQDVVVGTTSEAQPSASHELWPARAWVDTQAPVALWLKRIGQRLSAAERHLQLSSSQIQAHSEVPPSQPLFLSVVRYAERPLPHAIVQDWLKSHPVVVDVSLGQQPTLEVHCERGRFDEGAAERILGHVYTTIEGMLTSHGTQVTSALPLLTPMEERQIVHEWNATTAPYPENRCLHQLFEDSVSRQPEAIALICGKDRLTYSELNSRANQLARYLQSLGVCRGDVVGVCLSRSSSMVAAVLGILKVGAAYLPLDPGYPDTRVAFMLADAEAEFLVTEQAQLVQLPALSAKVVSIDAEWSRITSLASSNIDAIVRPEDLSYVIYTSGSTGQPKGVVLNHRGRVNNFYELNQRYSIGPDDRLLGLASLSFDMSAYDIFGTLMAGATLVLVESSSLLDPAHWARLIVTERVTVWHSVQALLTLLLDYVEDMAALRPTTLRLVWLGGDRIPPKLPDRVKELVPGVRVVSIGGATEVSMDSLYYDIDAPSSNWTSIPYGRPMANQLAYVLDHRLRPLPVGVPGELHLGGVGVAEGYRNRPDLTLERFVPDPFSIAEGARLYKTGDLARFMPDGNLELLGRMDFQVKIRGVRVELGEVIAALARQAGVAQCTVAARRDGSGEQYLAGYVVLSQQAQTSADVIKQSLASSLPRHLVPASIIFLPKLPLSPNGKIDVAALPEPQLYVLNEHEYCAPRTSLERLIAEICADVLQVERVSIHERFAALGISSLAAVRIITRIEKSMSLGIPFSLLMEQPTIAALAKAVSVAAREVSRDPEQIAEGLRSASTA